MSQPNSQALPDITRMSALKDDFLKQYYNSTQSLLPSLRGQLEAMLDRLLSTDRLISDRVLGALVLVGNHKWDAAAMSLEETRLSPTLNDEQREVLLRTKREILEQDALRDLASLREKGLEIAEALGELAKVRLPKVDERMEILSEQEQALGLSVIRLRQQIDESETQLAALAEVIMAFEAPDLQKILNRMIPTEAELALIQQTLVKSGASLETLAAAARIFVEKLSEVVQGRRLVDVINTRNRKQVEHGGLLDDLCAAEARRANVARELEQLPRVMALGGVRDQWLELASALSGSWTQRIEGIEKETELLGMADALCAMGEYLLAVRRLYEEL